MEKRVTKMNSLFPVSSLCNCFQNVSLILRKEEKYSHSENKILKISKYLKLFEAIKFKEIHHFI